MKAIKHLNLARQTKNDEFYTYYQDAERVFKLIKDKTKWTYILPFNDNGKAFHKLMQDYQVPHFVSEGDYKDVNYKQFQNGLVISNPPYSIFNEIIKFFYDNSIKFILICPVIKFTNRFIFEKFKNFEFDFRNVDINFFEKKDHGRVSAPGLVITNLFSWDVEDEFWKPVRIKNTSYEKYEDVLYVKKIGQDIRQLLTNFEKDNIDHVLLPISFLITKEAHSLRAWLYVLPYSILNGEKTFKRVLLNVREYRKYRDRVLANYSSKKTEEIKKD